MSDAATAAKQVATVPQPKPPLIGGGRVAAIVPRDFEGCYRLATVIKSAGMAPKSFTTVEQITVAMMHGMEVGLTPMAALQSIAVVNGMPTIWGDGMLGLVRASGLMEDIQEEVERDNDDLPFLAVCKVKRVDQGSWTIRSFSRAEAQKARLWTKQGPWTEYPQRMMQMRARSWALRDAFADVLRGLQQAEEAMDMVDVTARGVASTAPPEPRRSDFIVPKHAIAHDEPIDTEIPSTRPETSQSPNGGEDGGQAAPSPAAAGSDSQPEASGQPAETFVNWRVENVVGEAAIIKAIKDLIDVAPRVEDVDAVMTQNADRLAKFNPLKKGDVERYAKERRDVLASLPA